MSVEEIGTGLCDLSLPHDAWTHEAHLAAAIYLLVGRPDLDASKVMPSLIRAYNEKNGVANTDYSGFHATITEFYLRALDLFVNGLKTCHGVEEIYHEVLGSPVSERDFLMNFYSHELLFSRRARATFVYPDLNTESLKAVLG